MGPVYQLTLRQLSGKWRLSIMTVLASLPVIIAVIMLRSDSAPSVREFETAILSAMLAGSIAPLVVLAIAAAAMGNELEDRTLANLTLSPIARWKIAVPKLLGVITIAAPFTLVSAFLTSWVAFLGDDDGGQCDGGRRHAVLGMRERGPCAYRAGHELQMTNLHESSS